MYLNNENKSNATVAHKSNENAKNIGHKKEDTSNNNVSETNKKNQKSNKNQSKKNKSPNRAQESDDEKETNPKHVKHNERVHHTTENKHHSNSIDNNNSSDNNHKNSHQRDGKHRNATIQHESNDKERDTYVAPSHNSNINTNRSKEKERSTYTQQQHKSDNHIHNEKHDNTIDGKNDGHSKFNSHEPIVTALHHKSNTRNPTSNQHNDDSEITYFNSNRNKNNKTISQHDTNIKSLPSKQQITSHGSQLTCRDNQSTGTIIKSAFKREEGWKEVSRKSSTQQHTPSDMSVKKIIIPTYAISRVIGRAGSNINAIRAATGAHIEVEKQGKSQNDRMITIKGSADAAKQASVLIAALVKDPGNCNLII